MKNHFKGWHSVYGFTFSQSTKTLGFKGVTLLIAAVTFGLMVLMNILMARPSSAQREAAAQKEMQQIASPIQNVYILNETIPPEIFNPNFFIEASNLGLFNLESFNKLEWMFVEDDTHEKFEERLRQVFSYNKQTIGLILSQDESGFLIEMLLSSEMTEEEGVAFLDSFSFLLNQSIQNTLSLSEVEKNFLEKPLITNIVTLGEQEHVVTEIIQMIAPMIFGLLLYMMLLFHGQTISKTVATEKTSKLVETLLTSVHPYALLAGKILAITSIAIMQFAIWIVSGVGGLFIGNKIAYSIYPESPNPLLLIGEFIKAHGEQISFSVVTIVLVFLFFCVGFLFYCILAGVAGSMVSKPEDIAHTQAIFQLPVIVSWLVSYMAPVLENETLLFVARYIPFTSPFCVPVDLLTGSMTFLEGIVSMGILSLFCLLTVIFSSKLYKGLLLYTGQKLTFHTLKGILKGGY